MTYIASHRACACRRSFLGVRWVVPPSTQYISRSRARRARQQDILLITGSVLIFGNQVTPLQVFGACPFRFSVFNFFRGVFLFSSFWFLPALWRICFCFWCGVFWVSGTICLCTFSDLAQLHLSFFQLKHDGWRLLVRGCGRLRPAFSHRPSPSFLASCSVRRASEPPKSDGAPFFVRGYGAGKRAA